jgi:hypothetical protein
LQFSSATYSVTETQGTATITVTRTGGFGTTVSVHYATSNGTATAGPDYTAVSGTLTFGPTDPTKTFAVTVLADVAPETSETVNLALSAPGGAVLGARSTAVLTISVEPFGGAPASSSP